MSRTSKELFALAVAEATREARAIAIAEGRPKPTKAEIRRWRSWRQRLAKNARWVKERLRISRLWDAKPGGAPMGLQYPPEDSEEFFVIEDLWESQM